MDRHYKDILLLAERQCNAKRGQSLLYFRYGKRIRKQIESAFSKWLVGSQDVSMQLQIRGLILKLMILITAFTISFLTF